METNQDSTRGPKYQHDDRPQMPARQQRVTDLFLLGAHAGNRVDMSLGLVVVMNGVVDRTCEIVGFCCQVS